MKKFLILAVLAVGAMTATNAFAGDHHGHSHRGGRGFVGANSYHNHGSQYQYGGWGNGWGVGIGWMQPQVYHDTSHWDYHPPTYYRHGNHYHYQPGHYDFHQTGHWHR